MVRAAGCTVSVDRVGNIFARRPGVTRTCPPVMTGSHIDTQPTGGKFDGCFGVMAGLEVIRTLNDLGVETEAPLEVVVWTNEEGSRFAPCMMGSGVFAGKFTLEETLAKRDADGVSVGEALDAIGYAGARDCLGHPVGAISRRTSNGADPRGRGEDHRRGARRARAEMVRSVPARRRGTRRANADAPAQGRPGRCRGGGRGGQSRSPRPSAACLRHGRLPARLSRFAQRDTRRSEDDLDFRHLQPERLDSMIAEVRQVIAATCEKHGLQYELVPTADFPPLYFDQGCVGAVREAAQALGMPQMDIVSGAGHDAIFLAELGPAGMIFVPCENGISHNEIENASPDDLAAGCAVLLRAMLQGLRGDRRRPPGGLSGASIEAPALTAFYTGSVGRITPGALSADARLAADNRVAVMRPTCCAGYGGALSADASLGRRGAQITLPSRSLSSAAASRPRSVSRTSVGVLAEGGRRVAVFHRRLGQANRAGHLRHRPGQRGGELHAGRGPAPAGRRTPAPGR